MRASVGPTRRCAGSAVSSSAVGGPVAERVMGRGRSSGNRGRGRGSRRFVARVGSRRRAPVDRWSAGCVSQSRRSESALGREDRVISLGEFRHASPMRRFAPSVVCVPKPGRPCPQRQTPIFFRRCRGALFVSGASAGLFPSPRTSLHRQAKKLASCRPPLCYGPPPPPDGRRLRVQARSLGQAFRDRTEGNKPASGRRNPRPRKSGSRS